jgi:hypothetical protein
MGNEISDNLKLDIMGILSRITNNMSRQKSEEGVLVDISLKNGNRTVRRILNLDEDALIFSDGKGHMGDIQFTNISRAKVLNNQKEAPEAI